MKQSIFTITGISLIADGTYRLVLEGDTSSLLRGGQFVDIALDGKFLRRPLAAQKWDGSEMTVIFKVRGEGTAQLASLPCGARLDILTGLGNGFDHTRTSKRALVVGGSIGASPLFTLTRDLIASGRKVTAILGFISAKDIILEDEYRALGADVHVVTDDGSSGIRGLVTDLMPDLLPGCDYFYTCGPAPMMRAVCNSAAIPGEASLEERMGCGCGICYGCTCHTSGGPRRICKDGPVFRKEEIVW